MGKPTHPLPPVKESKFTGLTPKEILNSLIENKEKLKELYEEKKLLTGKFLMNFGTETIYKDNKEGRPRSIC